MRLPGFSDRRDGSGDAEFGMIDRCETRCLLCQRVDPPFERAVAYGSYEGGLRDLIHLLKFQQVRPAAAVLGRLLAETIAALEKAMPVGTIAVVPVPPAPQQTGAARIQPGGDDCPDRTETIVVAEVAAQEI